MDAGRLRRLHVETRASPDPSSRGGGAVAAAGGAPGAAAPLSPLGGASADGHSARFPASKTKLDNLFLQWLSLPESRKLVGGEAGRGGGLGARAARPPTPLPLLLRPQVLHLLEDARAGRPLTHPTPAPPTAASPLSPATAAALFSAPPPLSPLKGGSGVPRSPVSPRPAPAAAEAAASPRAPRAGGVPPISHPGGPPPPPAVLAARRAALDAALAAGAAAGGLTLPAVKAVAASVFGLPPVAGFPLFSRLVPPDGAAVAPAALAAWIDAHGGVAAPPGARLFDILRGGDAAVGAVGLKALVAGVLSAHPGLEFLQDAPEFQDR